MRDQIVLIFVVVVFLVASLIGGILIRSSITIYNKFAHRVSQVPEPPLAFSIRMFIVMILINFFAAVLIHVFTQNIAFAAGFKINDLKLIKQLIQIPTAIVILISVLKLMLPTTWLRAFLLSVCYLVMGSLFISIFASELSG